MARVEVPVTIINSSTGLPVNGAAVAISHRATGTNATWYPSESGGVGSTAAVITDSNGRVHAWLERGAYSLSITGTGITPYTEAWDAVPAVDGSIDQAWMSESVLLPGELKLYAGSVIPSGWLACDGAQVSRTTYNRLWLAIGSAFGAGDGSTTFNLPDMRGRVPMGAGTGSGLTPRSVGQTGGVEAHTLTAAQSGIGPHTHSNTFSIVAAGTHSHSGGTGWRSHAHSHALTIYGFTYASGVNTQYGLNSTGLSGSVSTGTESGDHYHSIPADGSHSHSISGSVSSNSGDASSSHPNVQPFSVVNYIIKT